jgi:phage shock protein A
MKEFITWLMGEQFGSVLVNTWRWLWQSSPTKSAPGPDQSPSTADSKTVQHAQEFLQSLSTRVLAISEAVTKVRATTAEIQSQYNQKTAEHQSYINLAKKYHQQGQAMETRLNMIKALSIERIFPEIQARLEQSQKMLFAISEFHANECAKLDLLRSEMENIKARTIVGASIGSDQPTSLQELQRLQEKFREAEADIEARYQELQVMTDLSAPASSFWDESSSAGPNDIEERIKAL